jgi:hypothetical protein
MVVLCLQVITVMFSSFSFGWFSGACCYRVGGGRWFC